MQRFRSITIIRHIQLGYHSKSSQLTHHRQVTKHPRPNHLIWPTLQTISPNKQLSTMSFPQLSALKSALTADKPDYTSTALTFTEPITQAISSGASEEILEEKLSSTWRIFIDLAAKTDHQSQEPLIEILKAVQKQSEKKETVTIWGDQVKMWHDMPLLGAGMRRAWNRGMYFLNQQYPTHSLPSH